MHNNYSHCLYNLFATATKITLDCRNENNLQSILNERSFIIRIVNNPK